MQLFVVGVNHRRAAVEQRERLAFAPAEIASALDALRAALHSSEELILSTCNRVELYAVRDESTGPPQAEVAAFLAAAKRVPLADVEPVLYTHTGAEAIRHLFKVASSLDSMVLGETQIIAQVKEAYHAAKQAGHTGRVFNQLFQRALHVAKRVHSTTSIGDKNVSVPSVAARLAEKVFQDLSTKCALILGAGETGTLTLQTFKERGVGKILVVNRTLERAEELVARLGGHAQSLDHLASVLPIADIVIACLQTTDPIILPAMVQAALQVRRGEPMFFIDIAVPRNINPEVNRLDNVYLFNMDDLESIVNQNLVERTKEVSTVLPLIELEAATTLKDIELVDVEKVLVQLRAQCHEIGDDEMKRTLDRLTLAPHQREEVEQMVRRVLNKVLHSPTTALKEEAHNGRSFTLIELALRLFGIHK
jgi:glutamyl-tRNA reductase